MRSEAPPLLPILRSRTQGEILAALLVDPVREWTVTELARHLDIPLTTSQSEVTRLEAGGLLRSRKVGRSRVIRPNTDNPIVTPLTQIIMVTFGPPAVIRAEFTGLGATRIMIFGSWAARLSGERDDVYAAAERAEVRLGRPVNPVLRSCDAWQSPAGDPLLDEIHRRPSIEVMSAGRGTVSP
jgi:DNA-binding transcriptional ArsR family regulator